jgi:CubicO group peptidase (beta-lactamase class C family)
MRRRSFLLSAGAAALAPARARPAGAELRLAGELDAAIGGVMARGLAPGLAVAIYSREGSYARGFGVTDVATGERASADTAFYVASSTKGLTSLALAALHQRRVLDLDSTLSAYAPDAPFPAAVRPDQARLRDLLAHAGGIQNDPIAYRVAFTGEHDPKTLWRLLAASRPNLNAPLGKFEYTNTGYNLVTILTDRRLGVRWQDLLRREIFAPAGLTRSTARMSQARAAGWSIARPHELAADGQVRRTYLEKTDQTMQSAGGVVMSARDAARYLELMVEDGCIGGRQVVSAEAVRATRVPVAKVGQQFLAYTRDQYGLGWYLGGYDGQRMLHDFGAFSGFRAHVSYLPDAGIGVAAFVNDDTLAFPLVDAVANLVYDRLGGRADARQRFDTAVDGVAQRRAALVAQFAARASRPWTLTRPRAAYAGAYANPDWGRIDVAVAGDEITLRMGIMHGVAQPFTAPDSLRVELAPGAGSAIVFEGSGPRPRRW